MKVESYLPVGDQDSARQGKGWKGTEWAVQREQPEQRGLKWMICVEHRRKNGSGRVDALTKQNKTKWSGPHSVPWGA